MNTGNFFDRNHGVFCKGICRKNMDSVKDVKPGEIIQTSISTGKAVYIPKLKVYPGVELSSFMMIVDDREH